MFKEALGKKSKPAEWQSGEHVFLFGVAHFPKHTKHGNEVQTSISQDMRPPSLKPEVVISTSGIREPRHSRQHGVCSSAASLTFKDMLCNCWKSIIKEIQHPLISPPHHTLLWFLRPSRARKLEKISWNNLCLECLLWSWPQMVFLHLLPSTSNAIQTAKDTVRMIIWKH